MTDLCTPPGAVRDATPLPHRRLHRAVFLAAGFYNLGWGLYAVVDPQWLFRFAQLPLQNHPEVFASLGMVIGLYGILYLEVARHPEQHWPVAAVGMAGKVLGRWALPISCSPASGRFEQASSCSPTTCCGGYRSRCTCTTTGQHVDRPHDQPSATILQ
jgi:hypothetical protein